MFSMGEFKKKVATDFNSAAFALLERVVNAMGEKGVDPYSVMGVHVPAAHENWFDYEPSTKYIDVSMVSRHNGTAENVSVKISLYEKTGKHSAKRIFEVKVPKNASDNVINKRIDAVMEAMQTA